MTSRTHWNQGSSEARMHGCCFTVASQISYSLTLEQLQLGNIQGRGSGKYSFPYNQVVGGTLHTDTHTHRHTHRHRHRHRHTHTHTHTHSHLGKDMEGRMGCLCLSPVRVECACASCSCGCLSLNPDNCFQKELMFRDTYLARFEAWIFFPLFE